MAPSNPLGIEFAVSHNPSENEQAIFDYLTTYLPADSSITPEEAVQHINTLCPEDLDATGVSFLYRFWELVYSIGPQLDYRQEPMQRYLALLVALEILPDIIQGGAYPGRNSHASRLYTVFAFSSQWDSYRDNREASVKSARHWQNMNGLDAYMNGTYYGGERALETITMALEDTKLEESQVGAASIWFTLHAPGIYRCCLKREGRDPSVRGSLWTSRPKGGYSIARWMFWRERLAEMCDCPKVEEETAHNCRDAIQEMDNVSKLVSRTHIVERIMAFLQKMGS